MCELKNSVTGALNCSFLHDCSVTCCIVCGSGVVHWAFILLLTVLSPTKTKISPENLQHTPKKWQLPHVYPPTTHGQNAPSRITSAEVTDEELHTCFVAAESLVNSRPLTYQSAHQADFIFHLLPTIFFMGSWEGSLLLPLMKRSLSQLVGGVICRN